jgi:hypothetical protein
MQKILGSVKAWVAAGFGVTTDEAFRHQTKGGQRYYEEI